MAGLLNVGKSCYVCSQVDFLPISCPSCHNIFCQHHIQIAAHSCSAVDRTEPTRSFTNKILRCSLGGCKNPSLNAYGLLSSTPTCTVCQDWFCAEHREATSHSCSPKEEPSIPVKNETARTLLAKNFPLIASSKTPVTRRTAKPTDPIKLAQYHKLELMKLRQRASPVDPRLQRSALPTDKRRFFKASLNGKVTKDLWIERTVTAGKAFDLLASQFGIPDAEADKYQLFGLSDNEEKQVPLQYDKPFADQVGDGEEVIFQSKA
ncbi:hypothetical protein BDP27DRAFT_1329807 [Rhodocollybia butyracea]|uniref:AN1-type domain-containing protein n=1 Tax=Rhodocollybia butyracea TaxID=206335 RepID=A0A9P5PNZ0_9AGAR|nr:hypothetical protein BDP27DRAFT_1329807 [Rhodocollybia butyracea]